MSIIDKLSNNFKIHIYHPPAKKEEIDILKKMSSIILPDDYIDMVPSEDIEICVQNSIYIRFWEVERIIEMNEAFNFQDSLPNSIAIGDNEGSFAIVYLNGNKGFGIYYVDFSVMDIEEAIYISPSLTGLLQNNQGINIVKKPY